MFVFLGGGFFSMHGPWMMPFFHTCQKKTSRKRLVVFEYLELATPPWEEWCESEEPQVPTPGLGKSAYHRGYQKLKKISCNGQTLGGYGTPGPKWPSFSWLINRGDPNYLLTGMILQVW